MHLLTQSSLLRALGWSLFNSLWQMALLRLLYFLLIKIFKGASAHARHGGALLLLGVGSVCVGVSFVSVYFLGGADDSTGGVFAAGIAFPVVLVQPARQLINEVLPYCSFLYLLILLFLFLRYSNHYLHSRRLKTTGLSRIQPELRLFVAGTARVMGIGKEVKVWLSSLVDGPATLGFLKPVILIPFATVNNLSVRQMEAILIHELAHIKRNDYVINLGVTILETLFFFNPFARLLIKDIKKEREHRCDDLVMEFRYDPPTYISALLSLATGNRQQLALAAAGGNDQFLLQRVKRLLRQEDKTGGHGIRTLVVLLIALAASFFSLSRTSSVSPAPPPERAAIAPQPVTSRIGQVAAIFPFELASVRLSTPPLSPMAGEPRENKKRHRDGGGQPQKHTVIIPSADEEEIPAADELLHNVALVDDGDYDDAPVGGQLAIATTTTLKSGKPGKREYSIGPDEVASGLGSGPSITIISRGQPYVPGGSFSFRYMEDSTRPEVQLAYWQASAARELELAVKKMQTELKVKLTVLQAAQARQQQQLARQLQRQLIEGQAKWQQEFLQKQRELEKKLEKMGSRLTIVYI